MSARSESADREEGAASARGSRDGLVADWEGSSCSGTIPTSGTD